MPSIGCLKEGDVEVEPNRDAVDRLGNVEVEPSRDAIDRLSEGGLI